MARPSPLSPSNPPVADARSRRARAWVRRWPWVASLAAAAAVDLCIGAARHFDFVGIEGFSTTNYGWLAFGLVGGVGFAWRLARPPAGAWLLVRWLVAPAVVFVACFLLVTLTALVFLPDQSLGKTLTTDAPGRAFWLCALVALASVVCELWWVIVRARRPAPARSIPQ